MDKTPSIQKESYVRVVNDHRTRLDFCRVDKLINEGDSNWTPAIDLDLDSILINRSSSLLSNAKIKAWVAYDKDRQPIGRIAALHHLNRDSQGYIGYFESRDSEDTAYGLFASAVSWLKKLGCKMVVGPVNFGEKDRYCGILSEGCGEPGLFMDNYNPNYYQHLFSAYGFTVSDEILTLSSRSEDLPLDKLKEHWLKATQNTNLTFQSYCFGKIEKFTKDIYSIYRRTFSEDTRIKHLSSDDIKKQLLSAEPALNEGHIWLAYDNEEPIAWMASILDLNQQHRLAIDPSLKEPIAIKGMAAAVLPAYQSKGVALAMFYELFRSLSGHYDRYTFFYSGINSRTNKMIALTHFLNGQPARKHLIYSLSI